MRAPLFRSLSWRRPAWGLALSLLSTAWVDAAIGTAMPSLESAVTQLQSGDAAGAAKSLKAIIAADPRNAAAWRALAASEATLHHYDAAIIGYRRALEIQPDAPRVFYQLGAAYAAK